MRNSTRVCGQAGIVFVLPSMKISGGVQEALGLAADLSQLGVPTEVVSLWVSPHPVPAPIMPVTLLSQWVTHARRVPLQLPAIALRFARWLRHRFPPNEQSRAQVIFTHYSTLPLALLVVPQQRWVFVQDLEWKFMASPLLGGLLRAATLALYRRCRLIAANDYLKAELQRLGLTVEAEAPIWAGRAFVAAEIASRDIDLVMVLRKGAHKRLDLYVDLLRRLKATDVVPSVAVITTEDEIAAQSLSVHHWLRPDVPTMRSVYARARCFVHLSEHEGFGLPPLEAMAAGCVPYCRDSGGIRAYMVGDLNALVVPRSRSVEEIAQDLLTLLGDSKRLEHLSGVARAVFQSGLDRAATRRAHLSECLSTAAAR